MGSSRLENRPPRFNAGPISGSSLSGSSPGAFGQVDPARLRKAIERTRNYLLSQQHPEGYWVGELEGDTILESEYILLLAWLDREHSETALQCAEYIRRQQADHGGWSLYPGGPLEISASVKAYFALKLTGDDPQAAHMIRAREAIRDAGGVEKVNSFTRYYLALLGVISYRQCPAVPPELVLLPRWMPFNIHEMSAWSRTILVPLSLLWAFQPVRRKADATDIRELFLGAPEKLSVVMGPAEQVDGLHQSRWMDWAGLFRLGDRVWKLLETCRIKPLRRWAIRRAQTWMMDRLQSSDGLGAIFPPIVWSIVALRCLGYDANSPEVTAQLDELEKLTIRDGQTARLEPCRSPVWDTALTMIALRDAGVPAESPELRRSVEWLLAKEVRQPGDWSVNHPEAEPGGWFFEFNNPFYPDVDDTIMVTMALARALPGRRHREWMASLVATASGSPNEAELSAVITGTTQQTDRALSDIERMTPILAAIRRAVGWVLLMQGRHGGWGAFDADNTRELLTQVPFADHNAMIDPPTADITARVLEMFGTLGVGVAHPVIERAIDFVWREQEPDHCWYGRWGVNYVYGTWQCLAGLREIGIPATDMRIRYAVGWLKDHQQADGSWGETPRSYDVPELRGEGPATPSQTAWALLGLMAAGEVDSEAVRRGIHWLLEHQEREGTWVEETFTGTGFPRVFYLRYHMYRIYFPLMALSRYARMAS